MTHVASNPHEEAARLRKAYKLADCAQAHELPLELLEDAGEDFWKTCAEQAVCNPPSQATVDLVISIIRKRSATASESPTSARERRPAPSASKVSTAAPAQGRPAVDPSDVFTRAAGDGEPEADYVETGYDPFEGLDASPGPWSGLG